MSKNYNFENEILNYESYIDEFTPELFEGFNLKAEKLNLMSKINNLVEGEIVNKTEHQAAFHPKYRKNIQAKKTTNIEKKEFLIPHIKACIKKGFKEINIITLGIGGSYEGPKLLLESFNRPLLKEFSKIERTNYGFITGSDPVEFENKIKFLKPDNTFFIVSSKSFSTDETIENLKKAFTWSGDKNKFVAITANSHKAKKYGIDQVIKFDKEIGGRYSIWSPITRYHLCNEDAKNFAQGGHQADIDIKNNKDYIQFLKVLSFSDIYFNNKGLNVRAILSYAWKLRSLPDYLQQLEMESLGKPIDSNSEFNHTGQIIFGGYGPTAQHSYFQLLHQGTHKICTDIVVDKENTASLSYAQAITQSKLLSSGAKNLNKNEKINGNAPVNLFLLNKLCPHSLGYLIATWEYRTYITAIMLDINPFDQYGVHAGKNFTRKFLKKNR